MSAQQMQAFLASLTQLPADVNPYAYFRESLFALWVAETSKAFEKAVWANIGVSIAGALFGCIALVAKGLSGGLWICRKKTVQKGVLLAPNTTLLLVIFITLYFILNIMSDVFMLQAWAWRGSAVSWNNIQGILWLQVWLCAWSECCCAVAAYLASSYDQDRRFDLKRMRQGSPLSGLSRISPKIFNIVFISGFCVQSALMLTLFSITAYKDEIVDDIYNDLVKMLAQPTADWQPGQPFALNPTWLIPLTKYADSLFALIPTIRRTFLTEVGLLLAVACIFVPFAILQLRSMRQQLRSYTIRLSSNQARLGALRNTYRLMHVETAAVLLLILAYASYGAWVGGFTEKVLQDGNAVTNIGLLAGYTFAGICGPLNVVLAWRSIQPLLKRRNQRHFLPGITVHTEVARHVDVADEDSKLQNDNRYPLVYQAVFWEDPVPLTPTSGVMLDLSNVLDKKSEVGKDGIL